MRLSVVITNHDYARYLGAAIESCLSQMRPDDEVIVVDDGSTDGSLAVAEGFGPRIRLVAKANGGQASAWNAGFAVASGDGICLLDSDDVFLPGKLDAVRCHLSVGMDWCFHPLEHVDSELQPIADAEARPIPSYDTIRSALRRGRIPYLPTATSGMSFSRALAERILPMPELAGVTLSDNYLKFLAVSARPGVFLERRLAQLRIHGANRYSGTIDRRVRAGAIGVTTAWHLCVADPSLARFARRLFIDAAAELLAREGRSMWSLHPVAKRFANAWLGPLGQVELTLRAAWRRSAG